MTSDPTPDRHREAREAHDDEYDALARQFHESIAEGQSLADTAKALRILGTPVRTHDGRCNREDPCNSCLNAVFEAGRATGTVEGWADYTNAALSPAGPEEPREGLDDTVFQWLIERGQPEGQVPTVWWTHFPRDGWTTDAHSASMFPTKADAEAFIEQKFQPPIGDPSARAVEHGFLARTPVFETGAEERLRAALDDPRFAFALWAEFGWGQKRDTTAPPRLLNPDDDYWREAAARILHALTIGSLSGGSVDEEREGSLTQDRGPDHAP